MNELYMASENLLDAHPYAYKITVDSEELNYAPLGTIFHHPARWSKKSIPLAEEKIKT